MIAKLCSFALVRKEALAIVLEERFSIFVLFFQRLIKDRLLTQELHRTKISEQHHLTIFLMQVS